MTTTGEVRGEWSPALTGLVGVATVLVCVGHADGRLWPAERLGEAPWRGLVSTESAPVLLVAVGYLAAARLVHLHCEGRLDPVAFFGRAVWRWLPSVAMLCAALAIARSVDLIQDTSTRALGISMSHALAGTYDLFLGRNPLGAWPDLYHLWLIGVAMVWLLVLPLLVALLGERPLLLTGILCVLAVTVAIARTMAADNVDWIGDYTSPLTRGDGLLLGAAAGVGAPLVIPHIRAVVPRMAQASATAAIALLILLPWSGMLPGLRLWGSTFILVAAVLVASLAWHPPDVGIARALSVGPLTGLGTEAVPIFVWHLPLMAVIGSQTAAWGVLARIALFLVCLGVVVMGHRRWLTPRNDVTVGRGVGGATADAGPTR